MGSRDGGEEEDPVDSLAGDRQGRVPDVVTHTDQEPDQTRIKEIVSFISLENDKQVFLYIRLYSSSSSIECLLRLS